MTRAKKGRHNCRPFHVVCFSPVCRMTNWILALNLLAVMSSAARDLSDSGAVRRRSIFHGVYPEHRRRVRNDTRVLQSRINGKPLPFAAEVWTTDPGFAISEGRDRGLG